MPVPFPHQYSASLSRTAAPLARKDTTPRTVVHGAPSSERDGELTARSPQHMLLSSLGLCMLTTFETLAARAGIEIHAWDAKVSGTVEPTPEGLSFTSIVLELDMEVTGHIDRVEATLEDAKQHCLVLNSLRVPVVVETQVRTPGGKRFECYDLPAQLTPLRLVDHRHAS